MLSRTRAPATATRPRQQHRHARPPRPPPPVRRAPDESATSRKRHHKAADAAPPSSPSPLLPLATLAATLASSPATWATQRICFDVPDWAAGPLTAASEPSTLLKALLSSPPLAAAAALAAAALVPRLLKLARASLKYVLLALALWVAVSHPRESASTVQAALEFAQAHPLAASSLLVVAVAVSLGPEFLTTGALVGALLLFASAAGVIELPSLPKFPRLLPFEGVGTAVVERLERAAGGGGGGGGGQEERRGG